MVCCVVSCCCFFYLCSFLSNAHAGCAEYGGRHRERNKHTPHRQRDTHNKNDLGRLSLLFTESQCFTSERDWNFGDEAKKTERREMCLRQKFLPHSLRIFLPLTPNLDVFPFYFMSNFFPCFLFASFQTPPISHRFTSTVLTFFGWSKQIVLLYILISFFSITLIYSNSLFYILFSAMILFCWCFIELSSAVDNQLQ